MPSAPPPLQFRGPLPVFLSFSRCPHTLIPFLLSSETSPPASRLLQTTHRLFPAVLRSPRRPAKNTRKSSSNLGAVNQSRSFPPPLVVPVQAQSFLRAVGCKRAPWSGTVGSIGRALRSLWSLGDDDCGEIMDHKTQKSSLQKPTPEVCTTIPRIIRVHTSVELQYPEGLGPSLPPLGDFRLQYPGSSVLRRVWLIHRACENPLLLGVDGKLAT